MWSPCQGGTTLLRCLHRCIALRHWSQTAWASLSMCIHVQCPDLQVQAWLNKTRWARGIWSPLFSTLLLDCRGRHRQPLLWMLSIFNVGYVVVWGHHTQSCCIFALWLHLLRIDSTGIISGRSCETAPLRASPQVLCISHTFHHLGATPLPIVWSQGELVWICCNARQPEAQSEILAADFVIQHLASWRKSAQRHYPRTRSVIREHFALFLLVLCRHKSFRIRHHAILLSGHRCDAKDFRDHRSWTSNLSKNLSNKFLSFAEFLCPCDRNLMQGSNRSVYDITVCTVYIYI